MLAGECVRVHIPASSDSSETTQPVGAVAFIQVRYHQLDPVDFALSSVC